MPTLNYQTEQKPLSLETVFYLSLKNGCGMLPNKLKNLFNLDFQLNNCCIVMEAIFAGRKRQNVKSTEEMLIYVEKATKRIKKDGKNDVIDSMDVVGLYPNLNVEKSARMCGKAEHESYLEIVEANWEWATRYMKTQHV